MTQVLSADTLYWLGVCREFVGNSGLVKAAALGGDGQDTSFEQSFSNLAHAYLRDKAPTLLDHELGFQLVDRNQENTKAVGVFAFKVGSQRLFAPVFFLKGDLKGHELLYMRNQDMFVPLKENWLNYILNRKPNILGTGVARQTSRMGVRPPDLNRLSQSPYKFASVAVGPTIAPFMPCYGHLATTDFGAAVNDYASHCRDRLDLGHFLKQASLPALGAVVTMFKQRPAIAEAFDRWHGIGLLSQAIKEAKARLDTHSILDDPYAPVNRNRPRIITGSILKTAADGDNGPDYRQKIKIVTWDSSQVDKLPEGLDEEDQEKLLKDHVLIKDHRAGDEVSVPLNIQVEQRLSNPTETGIFQVLVKMHDFEKCLVVVDPHGPDGRKNLLLVIRLDESSRNWGNFAPKTIWVAGQDESLLPGSEESWDTWFDSLPDTTTLPGTEDSDDRYILVGPRRNATCPFKIKREIGNSLGTKSYEVHFSTDTYPWRPRGVCSSQSVDMYDPWADGERLHLDAKDGTDLRSTNGDVYIPKGYKVLKLQPTRADAEAKESDGGVCCGSPADNAHSDTPPVQPGNLLDATLHVMQKTAALRIDYDGVGYSVNRGNSLRPNDAVIHLVRDHGLREDAGRHLLKQAAELHRHGQAFECRVKYASPFLTDGGPTAPGYYDDQMYSGHNPMGWDGPTQQSYGEDIPIPEMSANNTDRNIYNVNPNNMPEPMDVNGVNQAMQSGQREVFDTAMIGSMLKAVRDDTMIDRYLPDLIKGVDRLGRILFMFYWHQDKFAERYGKQDMPELEDSLRNAFEMNGDVVLFLKQKTVEPYPEEDVQDIDLGQSSNL